MINIILPIVERIEDYKTMFDYLSKRKDVKVYLGVDERFKIEDNYYLVASDNYILNTNSITLTDTTIISAIRGTSSYYGYYSYNRTNEDTTIINLDYIVISNIETNKSVTSELFNDFKFEHNVVILITFILGLIFAIFLLRDRRY